MLTDYGDSSFPRHNRSSLEDNTLWDGLFHASTWLFVDRRAVPAVASAVRRVPGTWRSPVGLLLAGWGAFNLVEGIVDHHILTIHHVRDDVAEPLWWDLGFLVFGAALVVAGLALRGTPTGTTETVIDVRGSARLGATARPPAAP